MKILIVEDDEDKRQQLLAFISAELDADIVEARSYQSGMKALLAERFDLVLLDMSMTTFDKTPPENGGRPQPYAGREILQQMARRSIETNVIVVTQFDRFGRDDDEITLPELDKSLSQGFSRTYKGAVHYSVKYAGWQDVLRNFLKELNLLK